MRKIFFTTLAALVLAACAHAATAPVEQNTLDTTWKVSLDAQGHVIDLAQSTKVKALLSEPLARAIRSWEFAPGRVDGQPAPTETTLYVSITLEDVAGDGFAVRVNNVRTGGSIVKSTAPDFPSSVLRRVSSGFSALVVVEAHYDDAGKVVSTALAPGTPDVSPAFGKAALSAVKQWTFQPERVGDRGIAAGTYVPICFFVSHHPRGDFDCGEWTPPGLAGTDIGNGAAFALEPAATLKSDVIGRTL